MAAPVSVVLVHFPCLLYIWDLSLPFANYLQGLGLSELATEQGIGVPCLLGIGFWGNWFTRLALVHGYSLAMACFLWLCVYAAQYAFEPLN